MKPMARSIVILLSILIGLASLTAAQQSDQGPPPAIITFTSELPAVTMDALEQRELKTTLSWYIANLSETQQIRLQIYQLNEWGDVLPETQTLLAVDEHEITVEPPLNFGLPTYRLSIVDTQGRTLDERILTIPFDSEAMAEWQPEIEQFSTPAQNVNAADLSAGRARVEVSWRVNERLPNTNIVFEQIMEDGRLIAVELPRLNLWLPSEGTGSVAPLLPDQADEPVRLRARVIDLITREAYASAELVLPVVGTAVRAATATPLPNILPTPVPDFQGCTVSPLIVPLTGAFGDGCNVYRDGRLNIQIDQFAVSALGVVEAVPGANPRGDLYGLSWNITGSSYALIEVYDRNQIVPGLDAYPALQLITDLPPVGAINIILPDYLSNGARLVLWAYESEGNIGGGLLRRTAYVVQDIPVVSSYFTRPTPIPSCEPRFHFTPGDSDPYGCAAPVSIYTEPGAYQPFERGFMLWRSGDRAVLVFSKDGWFSYYQEVNYDSLPDNPVTEEPPAGRIKPVSGFGRIWGNLSEVREALGWALAPEQAYTMTAQTSAASFYYLTTPDGTVLQLRGNFTWRLETAP
ncbi:MAG: hypothetical protein JNJ61_03605 [Anaerolineae bacterium]|nr:hypothetical protein [Anaerolineae bacterium]